MLGFRSPVAFAVILVTCLMLGCKSAKEPTNPGFNLNSFEGEMRSLGWYAPVLESVSDHAREFYKRNGTWPKNTKELYGNKSPSVKIRTPSGVKVIALGAEDLKYTLLSNPKDKEALVSYQFRSNEPIEVILSDHD